MAANLLPLGQVMTIRACSGPGHVPESNRSRRVSSSSSSGGGAASSSNWWTPLFGWSSEPDYIGQPEEPKQRRKSESDLERKAASVRSKFAPGCFTEEKARLLRKLTADTSSFHDAMYHSAIASRLASDSYDRSDL